MYKTKGWFYFLVIVAVLVVAVAWRVVVQENSRLAQKHFEPFLLFPDFANRQHEIGRMKLEIGLGLAGIQKITLWRKAKNDKFRVNEASNFFAKKELTDRLIYGLSTLKAQALRGTSKTAHEKLGLIAPENLGSAIRISFYGFGKITAKKNKLASILIGNRPERMDDVLGLSAVYVRQSEQQQSYLARGSLPLQTAVKAWLDLNFFKRLLAEKINGKDFVLAKAQFSPARKKSWVLHRKQAQNNFLLSDRRGVPLLGVYDKKRIYLIEQNLKNLIFSAVQPAKNLKFKKAHIVIFESFSGLAVIFEIIKNQHGFWAKINVRPISSAAQPLAQKIQLYMEGFAFLLPPASARKIILTPNQLKKKRKRR